MVELSIEWGLFMLVVSSTVTSLVTEAIKKMFSEKHFAPNMIAAVVSIIVGAVVACAWVLLSGAIMEPKTILYGVALIVLSWLVSMLGYDKVMQALSQLKR